MTISLFDRLKAATQKHEPIKASPTLEVLVQLKKITPEEYNIYLLFGVEERGAKWIKQMIEETFMDQPEATMFTAEILAYGEGRRSIVREIKMIIGKVNQLLRGDHDD